jgi:hypothetical protein
MTGLNGSHRRIICAAAVFGVLIGVPAGAYAAQKSYGITVDGSAFNAHRTPADRSGDVSMPARSGSAGTVFSDVSQCPSGNASYNWAFIRDVTGLPDATIFTQTDVHYCWVERDVHPGWPSGDFHFNIGNYYLPEPDGTGAAGTRW